jgi:hypothetical protein
MIMPVEVRSMLAEAIASWKIPESQTLCIRMNIAAKKTSVNQSRRFRCRGGGGKQKMGNAAARAI